MAFEELEWNNPSRDNWYSMQVAATVQRFLEAFMKEPKPVKVEEFKIPFALRPAKSEGKKPAEMTMKEYCEQARAVWRGALGIALPPEE